MKITRSDTHTVSVPYGHRENSARVRRDGDVAAVQNRPRQFRQNVGRSTNCRP